MSVGRNRYARRNQNSISFKKESLRLGPISYAVVLVILACLLGLVYLTQVTKTNAYSYQIKKLQNEQSNLKEQRDELEVTAARLQALDTIKKSSQAISLVSIAPTAIQN